MLKLLLLIGALMIGFPLIIIFAKLILAALGISLGLLSLPLLLVGALLILPIVIIFGLFAKLLPIALVGGFLYIGYRYIKNREYY